MPHLKKGEVTVMENAKTTTQNKRLGVYRIVAVGLMAALAYVGNYLQIKIPNGVLVTRIHFGNSMCLLAGLLFGPISGGLASGIGAGLYDLLDPVYIVSAPYTFISKFAMGFVAGLINRHAMVKEKEKLNTILAAVIGQLVYIFLYLLKSYLTIIILGGTSEAAWSAVGLNAITSSVNAVIAVVVSVPLYYMLKAALKSTTIGKLITERKPSKAKEWFNPLTIVLTVFAIVVTILYSVNLAATKKVEAAQAEKEAAVQAQIDYLYDQLGLEYVEPAEDAE